MKHRIRRLLCGILILGMGCVLAGCAAAGAASPRVAKMHLAEEGYLFSVDVPAAEAFLLDLDWVLYVLQQEEDGGYRYVFRHESLEKIGDGQAYYDGNVICVLDDTGMKPKYLMPMVCTGRVDGVDQYLARALFQFSRVKELPDFMSASVRIEMPAGSGILQVAEVLPDAETAEAAELFNPLLYEYVAHTSNTRVPTRDADDNFLYFYDWDSGDLVLGFDMETTEMTNFGPFPIEAMTEGRYYALLEFYDAETETRYTVSNLIPLTSEKM